MRAFGLGEWAGQLVSTLAMFGVGVVVFFDLRRRYGEIAAACGFAAVLGVRTICHLATSIQPDALSLLFYAAGWSLFLRYRDLGKTADLAGYTVALTLAMLTKPPSGQLGISRFLLLLLSAPALLKRRAVWIAWGVSLLAVGLQPGRAPGLRSVRQQLRSLQGGTRRCPPWPALLAGAGYESDATPSASSAWGSRARSPSWSWRCDEGSRLRSGALLVANLVVAVFFIRVTADFAGAHYVVPAAILSAEAVAFLVADFLSSAADLKWYKNVALVLVNSAVLIVPFLQTVRLRPVMGNVDPAAFTIYDTGLELQKIARPEELIIVRAKLYDPRIFYIAHLHGWQLNHRKDDPAQIPEQVRRGGSLLHRPVAQSEPESGRGMVTAACAPDRRGRHGTPAPRDGCDFGRSRLRLRSDHKLTRRRMVPEIDRRDITRRSRR